jgi:hypothetical protein
MAAWLWVGGVGAEVVDRVPVGSDDGSGDNPYRAIVSRNAFGLKDYVPPPPPPPPPPAPVPEPPKLDVKLAGLGEIAGVRYAYLVVPDTEHPGQFVYPALTDNPGRGSSRHSSGLEIREIDIAQQSVRMVNGGIEAVLNLKEHGVKSAPSAPATPAGRPGGRPAVNVPGARTVVTAGATGAAAATQVSNEPMIFSRNANRSNTGNNAQGGGNTFGNPSGVNTGGGVNLPPRPLRTEVQQPTPQIQVSPEDQYNILIQQRQNALIEGRPLPPPIPGIPLEIQGPQHP